MHMNIKSFEYFYNILYVIFVCNHHKSYFSIYKIDVSIKHTFCVYYNDSKLKVMFQFKRVTRRRLGFREGFIYYSPKTKINEGFYTVD